MKTLLITIFLSLNIFAASMPGIQENYEQLSREINKILETTLHIDIIIGSALSLLVGLLIGFSLFKKLNKNKRDALSQNIIKDLEDEQTNLINQISYIEAQNENQISYIEVQNENQSLELNEKILALEKKILHIEKENETLINKNQELKNQIAVLKDSHLIICEELNKKANKAIEEKNTLFRQIEETIIF
ncbi:MAG: hypothetical protein KAR81_02560 [Sulfurimonas sp.]|nr:hypothetical protein [Sulfurimonas sp.]